MLADTSDRFSPFSSLFYIQQTTIKKISLYLRARKSGMFFCVRFVFGHRPKTGTIAPTSPPPLLTFYYDRIATFFLPSCYL